MFQGNGTPQHPIRVTTYGDGPKPEILGSLRLDEWRSYRGNIYQHVLPKAARNPDSGRFLVDLFQYDDGDVPRRMIQDTNMPGEPGHFLIYESGQNGIKIKSPQCFVANNTIINAKTRPSVRIEENSSQLRFSNNLVANLDPSIHRPLMDFFQCDPRKTIATMNHNLFYDVGTLDGAVLSDGGPWTCAEFQKRFGVGQASLFSNPRFADGFGRRYVLSSRNPAVDAGVDVGRPFRGKAPDIGWKELGQNPASPKQPRRLITGENDEADRRAILAFWGK